MKQWQTLSGDTMAPQFDLENMQRELDKQRKKIKKDVKEGRGGGAAYSESGQGGTSSDWAIKDDKGREWRKGDGKSVSFTDAMLRSFGDNRGYSRDDDRERRRNDDERRRADDRDRERYEKEKKKERENKDKEKKEKEKKEKEREKSKDKKGKEVDSKGKKDKSKGDGDGYDTDSSWAKRSLDKFKKSIHRKPKDEKKEKEKNKEKEREKEKEKKKKEKEKEEKKKKENDKKGDKNKKTNDGYDSDSSWAKRNVGRSIDNIKKSIYRGAPKSILKNKNKSQSEETIKGMTVDQFLEAQQYMIRKGILAPQLALGFKEKNDHKPKPKKKSDSSSDSESEDKHKSKPKPKPKSKPKPSSRHNHSGKQTRYDLQRITGVRTPARAVIKVTMPAKHKKSGVKIFDPQSNAWKRPQSDVDENDWEAERRAREMFDRGYGPNFPKEGLNSESLDELKILMRQRQGPGRSSFRVRPASLRHRTNFAIRQPRRERSTWTRLDDDYRYDRRGFPFDDGQYGRPPMYPPYPGGMPPPFMPPFDPRYGPPLGPPPGMPPPPGMSGGPPGMPPPPGMPFIPGQPPLPSKTAAPSQQQPTVVTVNSEDDKDSPGPDDSVSNRGGSKSRPNAQDGARRHASRPSDHRLPYPLDTRDRHKSVDPKTPKTRVEAWIVGTPDIFSEVSSETPTEPHRPKLIALGESLRQKSSRSRLSATPKDDFIIDSRDGAASTGGGAYLMSGALRKSPERKSEDATRGRYKSDIPVDRLDDDRQFPSTGKPLSTIASVLSDRTKITNRDDERRSDERSSSRKSVATMAAAGVAGALLGVAAAEFRNRSRSRSEEKDAQSDQGSKDRRRRDEDRRSQTVPEGKLTRHEDLISVLSQPNNEQSSRLGSRVGSRAGSRASGRGPSYSTASPQFDDRLTMDQILSDLAADEQRYAQDLLTLVDGIIPVLLSGVMSKSQTDNGGVFSRAANITQPVVDMGVALERIRSQHRRIPQNDAASLLSWSQNAARVYEDYINAWRMGFDDVVINVPNGNKTFNHDNLAVSSNGDLVNDRGERVDVAFLLKRPLVRIKTLCRTFKAIDFVRPTPEAEASVNRYQGLVDTAKRKLNDELARIEDEAAAAIDPSRTRDLPSLAPISGVRIDPKRGVRARDYFEMTLKHSSGQRIDCATEIFIRDNDADPEMGGDILICEVSDAGRWLLFPPIIQEMVSVRRGQSTMEIVMMIRGISNDGRDWAETMTLYASEEHVIQDWVKMLDNGPTPPSPSRTAFSTHSQTRSMTGRPLPPYPMSAPASPHLAATSQMPYSEIQSVISMDDVPMGEQPREHSRHRSNNLAAASGAAIGAATAGMWSQMTTKGSNRDDSRPLPYPDNGHRSTSTIVDHMPRSHTPVSRHSRAGSAISDAWTDVSEHTIRDASRESARPRSAMSERSASGSRRFSYEDELMDGRGNVKKVTISEGRESIHPRDGMSSRPASKVPTTPYPGTPASASVMSLTESSSSPDGRRFGPPSVSGKNLQYNRPPRIVIPSDRDDRKQKSSLLNPSNTGLNRDRQQPSPLRREYDPRRPTVVTDDEDEQSALSRNNDQTRRADRSPYASYSDYPKVTPPASLASIDDISLCPSNSASQGPYRPVISRRTTVESEAKASRTIANIFSWSDKGSWDALDVSEVAVFVTPGLIEAFAMVDLYNVPLVSQDGVDISPSQHGIRPLVAFELTPLVPLRRGTALDITIRSPPTATSKIRSSNNVMFRSRSPEECEILYNLINQARINNATYIALQNSRPYSGNRRDTWATQADPRNMTRNPSNAGGIFGLGARRGSTYRSNSARNVNKRSSVAGSDSSIGTMNSAFSAIRRLSGSGVQRIFSRGLNDSPFSPNTPQTAGATVGDSSSGDLPPEFARPDLSLGINQVKIRLYKRESASRWRDMGSSRMTILLPDNNAPAVIAGPGPRATPGSERRIVITGKTKGEILLDATLGEGSFERVARTGIAISVWRNHAGGTDSEGRAREKGGGVGASWMDVFMVQMKSVSPFSFQFYMPKLY